MKRSTWFAALLGGCAGGVLGWYVGDRVGANADDATGTVPVERFEAVQRELAALRADHERLERARQTSMGRSAVPVPRKKTAENEAAPPPDRQAGVDLAIGFGRFREEPALRTADWQDMGARARDVVAARKAGIGGRQPKEMAALEKKGIRELRRQLDAIASAKGELRGHPIVVVNLMASHLALAGLPFSADQAAQIGAVGTAFEAAAARLTEELRRRDALASERKLRGIELRKQHVDRIVDDVLTREQWGALFDQRTKGLLYYDVYQVGGLELERPHSSVYWRTVRADAREHLRLFLLTEWEIPRSVLPNFETLIDAWIDAVQRLPRHKGHPTSALHIAEVLPCANLHVQFQLRALALLEALPAVAARVRKNPVYVVFPRLRN